MTTTEALGIINNLTAAEQDAVYTMLNDSYKRAREYRSVSFTLTHPEAKEIIFAPPATIVYWLDGTKTVVKCEEDDEFDEEIGFCLCLVKKMYGNRIDYKTEIRSILKNAKRYYSEPLGYSDTIDFTVALTNLANSLGRFLKTQHDTIRDLICQDRAFSTKAAPPQTNADALRAMTDEELADWLIHLTEDDTPNWHKWVKEEVKYEELLYWHK